MWVFVEFTCDYVVFCGFAFFYAGLRHFTWVYEAFASVYATLYKLMRSLRDFLPLCVCSCRAREFMPLYAGVRSVGMSLRHCAWVDGELARVYVTLYEFTQVLHEFMSLYVTLRHFTWVYVSLCWRSHKPLPRDSPDYLVNFPAVLCIFSIFCIFCNFLQFSAVFCSFLYFSAFFCIFLHFPAVFCRFLQFL